MQTRSGRDNSYLDGYDNATDKRPQILRGARCRSRVETPIETDISFAIVGNSIAGQNHSVNATNADRRAHGYATALSARLNQQLRCTYANNFGVSGERIDQINARLATITAASVDMFICYDLVQNDVTNTARSLTQIKDDFDTFVETMVATDKIVYIGKPSCRSYWSDLTDEEILARRQVLIDIRDYITVKCDDLSITYPKLKVFDPWPLQVDTDSATYDPLPNMKADGLHDAMLGGDTTADVIMWLVKNDSNIWRGYRKTLPSVVGCLNTNPTMLGDGGSVGAEFTGVCPDNTRVQLVTGTSMTGNWSVEDKDIFGIVQRCAKGVITNTAESANEVWFHLEYPDNDFDLIEGDAVEVTTRVRIENNVGIQGVYLYVRNDQTTDFVMRDYVTTSQLDLSTITRNPQELCLKTEAQAIGVGLSKFQSLIRIMTKDTAGTKGCTIWIGQTEFRNV